MEYSLDGFVSFINPDLRKFFLTKEQRLSTTLVQDYVADNLELYVQDYLEIEVGDYVQIEKSFSIVQKIDYQKGCLILEYPFKQDYYIEEQEIKVEVLYNYEITLKNCLSSANSDCNAFVKSILADGLQVRFSLEDYVYNLSMVKVIDWFLQKNATKKDINISGASLQNQDIFDNFYKLRQLYYAEIEAIKKSVYDEMYNKKDGLKSSSGGGVMLRHRPIKRNGRYQ